MHIFLNNPNPAFPKPRGWKGGTSVGRGVCEVTVGTLVRPYANPGIPVEMAKVPEHRTGDYLNLIGIGNFVKCP